MHDHDGIDDPTLDPEPPFDLGKFYVLSLLGEGGTGAVYAAQVDGRVVALKVLRREVALSDREERAFVAEAERLGRVRHPNLVAVEEVGTLPDGRPYLVMPRLLGESLATRLGERPFSMQHALDLFVDLGAAVSVLHDAGLVHRDIKPENVFVERLAGDDGTGGGERLVLLDLGIAREIGAPSSTTTNQGLVRGTPAYMAPERFFGAQATISTDVYELAVLLHTMLTGGPPWDPTDPKERLGSVTAEALSRHVTPLLSGVLARALSNNSSERPASAKALVGFARAAGLEDIARGAVPRPRRSHRRSPGMAGDPHDWSPGPGPVQVTPPASGTLAKSELRRIGQLETQEAVPFPNSETTRTKRSNKPARIAVLVAVAVGIAAIAFTRARMSAPEGPVASSEPALSASSGYAELPECTKALGFFCAAPWRDTDGGAQCASFRASLETWRALPAASRESKDAECLSLLSTSRKALADRVRDLDAGPKP